MKAKFWALAGAVFCAAVCVAGDVVESAREIPVIADVDVLVVGGTSSGVAAAVAARQTGARVYLAGGFSYLGEDLAATLELGLDGAREPKSDITKQFWRLSSGLAPFTYKAVLDKDGPWTFKNDFAFKLAETALPRTARDSMRHTTDTDVTCFLEDAGEVARIEAIAFERGDFAPPADQSQDEAASKGARRAAAGEGMGRTVAVTATLEDGPRAGETVKLEPTDVIWVDGDYKSGRARAQVFSAPVNARIQKAKLHFTKDPNASCQFIARIRFPLTRPGDFRQPPAPMKVKRDLDDLLLTNGVAFITSSPVADVLVDGQGQVAGAVIANRSGRQAVRAKAVIDATMENVFTRLGAGLPVPAGGEVTFARVVKTGARPADRAAARVEEVDAARGLWRFVYTRKLTEGSVREWMRLAARSDHDTWSNDMHDQADCARLLHVPSAPARAGVWTVKNDAPLETRLAAGAAAGRAAAQAARARGALTAVRVEVKAPAKPEAAGDTKELLGGFRVWEKSRGATVPAAARALPVFAETDVVVVGLGTSGAPAAIGAARGGARVIGLEFAYVPGGVGTEGQIVGYYDGNHTGFTTEFNRRVAKDKAKMRMYQRIQVWRALFAEAGVEAWYGCTGAGAWTDEQGRVRGVVVVTPYGRGVIRARNVIDATGNSDIAAAVGAATQFGGQQEFALQSAGQAPFRAGRGGANSDFGYVNDTDALDVWLFSLKARQGALDAWDMSQILDSRERRRIVSDYMMQGWDVDAYRPFPDTIVQTRSRHDSHGYLVEDYWYVQQKKPNIQPRDLNVPFRSLLPKGVDNLVVVGLGAGVSRDVMPMVRMQADLMNMGYAAGHAAARAAKESAGDFRKMDFPALRKQLVQEKVLREEVLAWNSDPEPTDDELAAAVAAFKNGRTGAGILWRCKERALPLMQAAHRMAEGPAERLTYAQTLGLWGDATGCVDVAAAFKRHRDDIGLARALGRGHGPHAKRVLLEVLRGITPKSSFNEIRAVCNGLEELGDPAAALTLAEKLALPEFAGHDCASVEAVPPMGGYGVGPQVDRALVEISFARALLACGDWQGKGRAVMERYARDVRGFLAEHATRMLEKYRRLD